MLQRFGFCYFIVGLIQVVFASRDLPQVSPSEANLPFWWSFRDVKCCLLQWVVMLTILLIHASLTFLLPVPGCPTGYLGKKHYSKNKSLIFVLNFVSFYISSVNFQAKNQLSDFLTHFHIKSLEFFRKKST